MSGTRISATLVVTEDRAIACMACGHALGPAGGALEGGRPARRAIHAGRRRRALQQCRAGPAAALLLPRLRVLLDTESALAGDPFLNDIVRV